MASAEPQPEPQAEPRAEPQACGWCGKSASEAKLLRCGGCRRAWFCDNGKACLKQAWKAGHKAECKAAQAARKKVRCTPPLLTRSTLTGDFARARAPQACRRR